MEMLAVRFVYKYKSFIEDISPEEKRGILEKFNPDLFYDRKTIENIAMKVGMSVWDRIIWDTYKEIKYLDNGSVIVKYEK